MCLLSSFYRGFMFTCYLPCVAFSCNCHNFWDMDEHQSRWLSKVPDSPCYRPWCFYLWCKFFLLCQWTLMSSFTSNIFPTLIIPLTFTYSFLFSLFQFTNLDFSFNCLMIFSASTLFFHLHS